MELPDEVTKIFNKFIEADFQLFLVGGSVRDLIMGKKVNDWDFTTDAKPEEILKLFPNAYYNNKFGTVGIPIHVISKKETSPRRLISNDLSEKSQDSKPRDPSTQIAQDDINTIIEITTMRKEGDYESPSKVASSSPQIIEITTMRKEGNYKDHRHPLEVGWTNKIEEDLARRDFTINALAMDSKGKIADSSGGQSDLDKKIIKTVGNPNERFKEDALRLIRAIRFSAQLGFEIEEKTFEAIKQNAQLINDIAWERIRDELFKLLTSSNSYNGLLKLRETGVLQIILPELEKCFGIVQEGPKHDRIYDIGDHSFRTMRETPSKDPVVKLAALLHDVGKSKTFKKDPAGNVTFYNHDLAGSKIALEICKRFNLSKSQTSRIYKLIRWHMFSTNENQTDSAVRRFIKNVSLENIDDIMALRIGDRLGGDTRKPVSWRMEKFREKIERVLQKPFSISDLKINGHDIMKLIKIKPGPKVGKILNELFAEVLKDSTKNNKEYLTKKIKQLE